MVAAIQSAPAGYKPPCEQKIGGQLLDDCHTAMMHKLDARDASGSLTEAKVWVYIRNTFQTAGTASTMPRW